jgi:hypothetical protein
LMVISILTERTRHDKKDTLDPQRFGVDAVGGPELG